MPVEVPVDVNNSPIELHLPAKAKEKRAVVESKPSPFEVNNSIIELHLPSLRIGSVGDSRVQSRANGMNRERSGEERVCRGACRHSIDAAVP